MKTFITCLLSIHTVALAQEIPLPAVPPSIEFADITVQFTPEARALVANEVTSLLTPQNSYLTRKLERMQAYFPLIEQVLETEKIPDDLKYVAALESSLNPDAVSASNAVGFWQFKEPTATEFGLLINENVDERKEIVAATRAAANYFKKSNNLYNNWVSSVLTFHKGASGAAVQIPSNWAYANVIQMDANVDRYLIKAMAHRIAFEHRLNRLRDPEVTLQTFPSSNTSWEYLSQQYGIDKEVLRMYNPWLNGSRIPGDKNYNITVPSKAATAGSTLQQPTTGYPQLRRTTPATASDSEPILYEINGRKGILAVEGDEVPQVAKKGKVGVYKFLRFNDLTERDAVTAGKVYYLQRKARRGPVPYHTVQEGQTMWDISHMYGIRLRRLLRLNRLKTNGYPKVGRIIWLQEKRPGSQPLEMTENPGTNLRPTRDVIASNPSGAMIDRGASTTPANQPATSVPTPLDSDNSKELDAIFNGGSTKPATSTVPSTPSPATGTTTPSGIHIVQPTETLFGIARRYNVSVEDIRRWNNMSSTDVISIGQRLAINPKSNVPQPTVQQPTQPVVIETQPATTTTSYPEATTSTPATTTDGSYHIVKPGETLYRISVNSGVSVNELKRLNGLADNTISVGQRLLLRAGRTTTAASPVRTGTAAGSQTHIVKPGETLYRISVNYGVSVDELKRLNGLKDNTISVGQSIRVR